jgi:hypothetical protein
MIDSGRRCI